MRRAVRARLEGPLRRWWRGEAGPVGRVLDLVAAPLEGVYRIAVALRGLWLAGRGGTRVPGLRVVSIGNLASGGTGKTPLAAWAARALVDAGFRAVLISRGYGRDETLLHHRWNPEVPVLAGPDRVAAALTALARGANAAVLDDGFQHRRLARDVDVVLLAAEDPFPGRLLPRGPFREPPSALGRAHAVVVTRRTAPAVDAQALARRVEALVPGIAVGRVALVPGGWRDLSGAPAPPPKGPTLAVAAVARPEAFAVQVEAETGEDAELMAFPDHHEFGPADVKAMRARAGERTVVVTEKDAVKLQALDAGLGSVRVLAQALRWEAGEATLVGLVTAGKGP